MGGNVFQDTTPFDHADINKIKSAIDKILTPMGVNSIAIGSSATPKPGKTSNDLDVIVDQGKLSKYFDQTDPRLLRKKLRDEFNSAGFETSQSGVSVHVKVPLKNTAHQVDIMVVPNAKNAAKYHTHKIPDGSPYKGLNKHLALAHLAKEKDMLWSPFQGLFFRKDGKKAELATDNIDDVAKTLIGSNASAKDLSSVEAILSALPKNKADELLLALKSDPSWKENTNEELERIKQLSGIK